MSADHSDSEDQSVRDAGRRGGRQAHTKGRGFRQQSSDDGGDRYSGKLGDFDSFDEQHAGVQKSVEGFLVFVTGLHEEATEEDIHTYFGDFGAIQQLHLNLDRRTGFVKGYALLEFKTFEEASKAVQEMDGATVMDQKIGCSWALKPKPAGAARGGAGMGRGGRGGRRVGRSQSPRRR